MSAIPSGVLRLLHDELVPAFVESPADHIRNAIQLLILADERHAALLLPPDPMLTDLIRSAEARCFRALFELGQENGT